MSKSISQGKAFMNPNLQALASPSLRSGVRVPGMGAWVCFWMIQGKHRAPKETYKSPGPVVTQSCLKQQKLLFKQKVSRRGHTSKWSPSVTLNLLLSPGQRWFQHHRLPLCFLLVAGNFRALKDSKQLVHLCGLWSLVCATALARARVACSPQLEEAHMHVRTPTHLRRFPETH